MTLEVEDNSIRLREELDKTSDQVFMLKNKLQEKDTNMIIIKKELERVSQSSQMKKEIYITDPTKANVDLNNELNYTRDLIGKVSKLLNAEKLKNNKNENKLKELFDELNDYKSNN